MSLRSDASGVTAVIGTIMILGITVMGITAVMFWGGPALQRIQEQNAQAGMLGEFQEIRRDSLVLSITDSSRVPRINMESGTFGLKEGTRIQVSAMWDAVNTGCDLHVHTWGLGANDHIAEATITGCRALSASSPSCGGDCLRVYRVTGGNTVEKPASLSNAGSTYTITLDDTGADLTTGDWLFEISDASGDTVYAQAWLLSSLAVYWELHGASSVGLMLEGGAVFSSRDGTTFIQEQPPIAEEAFGTSDFVVRLPTYSGSASDYAGRSTPSLFLGLVGNHLRASQDAVHTVRFDFQGDNAEAWCNTMLLRNAGLTLGGHYTEDAAFPCQQAGDGVRALKFTSASTFPFEFIHARIRTSI